MRGISMAAVWVMAVGLVGAAWTLAAGAQEPGCSMCAVWNTPQKPFQIVGNTYAC